MIIVRYCGGLGNQMYQYAMQVVLEEKYPQQTFKADLFHYNLLNEHNGFELDKYFNLKINVANYKEVRRVFNGLIPRKIYRVLPINCRKKIAYKYQNKYWTLRNRIYPNRNTHVIQDNSIDSFYGKDLTHGDWYIRGMWQNLAWFDQYRDRIVNKFLWDIMLNDAEQKILEELKQGDAVAIHIRGGDFLNPTYNLCDANYYNNAYNLIDKPSKPVYIFTDDKEYAESMFKSLKIKGIVSHDLDNSIKDMYMMSQSKYLIISNSTFSFWGAYLNTNINGTIVAPEFAIFNGKSYNKFPIRKEWKLVYNGRQNR